MRVRVFVSIVVLTVFMLTGAVCAQTGGLIAGMSFPMGDFGDDSGEKAGLAKMGFMVGAEYGIPIGSTPGLFWVLSASFLYNSSDFEELYEFDPVTGIEMGFDVDPGAYKCFPLLTGIRYEAEVSPAVEIFGTGKVGMSLAMYPTLELTGVVCLGVECFSAEGEFDFDMATAFTFVIGGGIVFNEKFQIGFHYINLGEPEFDGDMSLTICDNTGYCVGDTMPFTGLKQPISMFALFAGIGF